MPNPTPETPTMIQVEIDSRGVECYGCDYSERQVSGARGEIKYYSCVVFGGVRLKVVEGRLVRADACMAAQVDPPKRYLLFGGESYYAAGGMVDLLSVHDDLKSALEAARAAVSRGWYEWWHIWDSEIGAFCGRSEGEAYGATIDPAVPDYCPCPECRGLECPLVFVTKMSKPVPTLSVVFTDPDAYTAAEKGELLSLLSELYCTETGDRLAISQAAVVLPEDGDA